MRSKTLKLIIDGKMSNTYSLKKDYIDRLHGCIFRYKDDFVNLIVDTTTRFILVDPCNGSHVAEIKPNDPDLDISSIELGYFNAPKKFGDGTEAIYAFRSPAKRYRQGISNNNVEFCTIDGSIPLQAMRNGVYFVAHPSFYDALRGKFPSFEEALDILETQTEVALSQELAIKMTDIDIIFLYFRTKMVGYIKKSNKSVYIPDRKTAWIVERILRPSGLTVRIDREAA